MKFRHIPRFPLFKITRRGIMLTLSESATISYQVLKALDTASAAFPPMQAATSAAVHVAEIVKDYSSHKEEWANFCTHIAATLRFVQEKISSASKEEARRLEDTLHNLSNVVQEIENEVKKYNKRGVISKFWLFLKDPEYIDGLEQQLNDAVDLFHFDNSVSVAEDVAKIRRLLENGKADDLLKSIVVAVNVSKIPMARSSAWNPHNACLPNTRTVILDDIHKWIYAPSKTAEIYFLADVVGSGKSAIANSVGVWCYEQNILASSFFFDRDEATRNHCRDVVLQTAHDLASRCPKIASLQDNNRHARHALSVQFEKLVIEPTQQCPLEGPQVLIFDALDEASNNTEFLQILRNDVPKLPNNFRVFVTSRNDYEIMRYFDPSPPHVSIQSIEVHDKANKDDIMTVIQHGLERVRRDQRLPQSWPSADELHQFQVKAEGLMIWVTTICDYLSSQRDAPRPEKALSRFLSAHSPADLHPVAKMEALYATILAKGNWNDDSLQVYQLVVGTIIAAKRPLSARAMQALLVYDAEFDRNDNIGTMLRGSPVRTLLTDCDDPSRPVQVLHLSFREFLTNQSHSTSPTFINEKKQSQRLAYCCIKLMNRYLGLSFHGMGYLANDVMHEPIPEITISDELLYACQFWLSHLDDVDDIESDDCIPLRDALRRFLSTHAVHWMETLAANGKYQPLLTPNVRKCLRLFTPTAKINLHPQYPQASYRLVKRLDFFDRVDEAYPASEETVELFHHLQVEGNTFQPGLYFAIISRTVLLVRTHQEEAAGSLAEEGLNLMAKFQVQNGADEQFLICQSRLHHNLSRSLTYAHRHQEALQHVKTAIELCQRLPPSDTYDGSKDLSFFTTNLCCDLNALGRTEEAIRAGEQAVLQLRKLIQKLPAFRLDLSRTLTILAECHESLNQSDIALSELREALQLCQEMAESQPVLQSNLALSWYLYAEQLNKMRRKTEAVEAVEESIRLFRKLNNPSPYHLEQLAVALNALSRYQPLELKGHDALLESIRTYRTLQSYNATRIKEKLASLLITCYELQGYFCLDDEDPAVPMKEAMEIYRSLSREQPRFLPDLAESLTQLAKQQFDSVGGGNQRMAFEWLRESVDIYRKLKEQKPEHLPDFIRALRHLAYQLDRRPEEDAEFAFEELALYTREVENDKQASPVLPELHHEETLSEAQCDSNGLVNPELHFRVPSEEKALSAFQVLATLHVPTSDPVHLFATKEISSV